ncbi:MAG: hypothetical protein NZM07_08285 [Elioraea sp.]|nr:hypothetical protein [Elioraea sp.]
MAVAGGKVQGGVSPLSLEAGGDSRADEEFADPSVADTRRLVEGRIAGERACERLGAGLKQDAAGLDFASRGRLVEGACASRGGGVRVGAGCDQDAATFGMAAFGGKMEGGTSVGGAGGVGPVSGGEKLPNGGGVQGLPGSRGVCMCWGWKEGGG